MRLLSESPSSGEFTSVLRSRVREAALWTAEHFDVDDQVGSLRRLASAVTALDLVSGEPGAAVRSVVEARAAALPASERSGALGRVLMFLAQESLCDGAAEQASDGWFDAQNVPPWDTWIGLIERDVDEGPVLLSWVPEALYDQTVRALDVNPEGCILWLQTGDPELARAIEVGH